MGRKSLWYATCESALDRLVKAGDLSSLPKARMDTRSPLGRGFCTLLPRTSPLGLAMMVTLHYAQHSMPTCLSLSAGPLGC